MKNVYKYQAKPTIVQGHKRVGWKIDEYRYDSMLEAKMASLLIKHGIHFSAHRKFDVFNRNGEPFVYVVDFFFPEPMEFLGISHTIIFLEVKGVLTRKDILRKDALEYCHNLRGYIATQPIIDMWERDGFKKG